MHEYRVRKEGKEVINVGNGTEERTKEKEKNLAQQTNCGKKNDKAESSNKNSFEALKTIINEGEAETDRLKNQEGSTGNIEDEGDVCRDKNGKSSSMLEDIVKDKEVDDFFTRLQKEDEMVGMFVDNKRIPTVEESKQWAEYMFGWYKEKWGAKWKSECPI